MSVRSRGDYTVLTCDTCGNAQVSLHKKEVPAVEWKDNQGWKDLRGRAVSARWRISYSKDGDHYCPKCIEAYDF